MKEMDKLDTKAAQAIIGAAIIDDVLSLLALSISEEVVSGTLSAPFIAITLVKAVAFLVFVVLLGSTVISGIMTRIDRTSWCDKYPESIFILAIMVAFFYSMIAELVGLSAIIGSFLAGVSLARIDLRHTGAR